MQKLNRNAPYGTISGETKDGAKFKQGGVRFDAEGNPIPGQANVNYEPDPVENTVDAAGEGTVEVTEPEPEPDPDSLTDEDFEGLAASEIKRMVIDKGGEYTDRATGIAFLKENQAA